VLPKYARCTSEPSALAEARPLKSRTHLQTHRQRVRRISRRTNEPDVEEREAAEGVVTPLVAGRDKCADETGDDHDEVEEDDGDDVREREAGVEEELEQEEWRRDRPVDVAHVLRWVSLSTMYDKEKNKPRSSASCRTGDHGGTRRRWRSSRGQRPWRSTKWRPW
jgi:hypothetical protein